MLPEKRLNRAEPVDESYHPAGAVQAAHDQEKPLGRMPCNAQAAGSGPDG